MSGLSVKHCNSHDFIQVVLMSCTDGILCPQYSKLPCRMFYACRGAYSHRKAIFKKQGAKLEGWM